MLTGGDTGPAALPGKIDESLIVEAVRYSGDGLQMPPAGKLPQAEIDILTAWVGRGLPPPAPSAATRG